MLRLVHAPRRAFTLLEVIISLVILGIGVVALLRLFPTGVQRSAESERLTRATLLAQEIMEAIKARGGSGLLPIIPGSPELVPMPGDGVDADGDGSTRVGRLLIPRPEVDVNGNRRLDDDYDGYPEADFAGRWLRGGIVCGPGNGLDDDIDGLIDDDGDSNFCGTTYRTDMVGGRGVPAVRLPDGDLGYDPEVMWAGSDGSRDVYVGVDEEWPDGIDNDGNGIDFDGDGDPDLTIDEDVRLASNWSPDRWYPLGPGDNIDNDGDGEENGPVDHLGRAVADGLDNDGDGLTDEGIDEEAFDGLDNDRDGRIDEDCRASSYPFTPRKFFRRFLLDDDGDRLVDEDPPDGIDNDGDGRTDEDPPNDNTDQFAWQIIVARVPDGGGDGIDNDGDGFTDEEIRDGLNDDPARDRLIDEDCEAAPVRRFRRVTVRITWNGDGDRNRDGAPGLAGVDDDGDGGADFDDPEIAAAMRFEATVLGIDLGDPARAAMLYERWARDDDEDGRIDEEKPNGLDDDFDGRVDEDVSRAEYNLTGFVGL